MGINVLGRMTAGFFAVGMARAAAAADLAAYGRLPSIEAVSLSPDGKLVAFIHPDGDKRGIIIISDIDTRKVVVAVDGGTNIVRSLRWADDDNLIVVMGRTAWIPGTNAADSEYSTATVFAFRRSVRYR